MRTNIQPYPATKGAMPKFPENGYYGLGRRIQLFAYAYYRLSREEAQKSESTSITNQKKQIKLSDPRLQIFQRRARFD